MVPRTVGAEGERYTLHTVRRGVETTHYYHQKTRQQQTKRCPDSKIRRGIYEL